MLQPSETRGNRPESRSPANERRSQIHRLVLQEVLTMTAGGVVVGLLAAIGLGQFITDQLYGVTLTDAPTFIAVTLLVITVLHASLLAPG